MITLMFISVMVILLYALLKWVLRPLEESNEMILEPMKEQGEITAVLKTPTLDLSKIPKYKGENIKQFIYRPSSLNDYIGQAEAKDLIKLNIKKINELKAVHFLISSIKGGVGKTTLAYIIANQLNASIIDRIGADFDDPKVIENILYQINDSENYTVLFIDEIHNLSKVNAERYFYRLMEDFTIQGLKIKPFTLIGATTNKDDIIKRMPPFIRRFQVPIPLKSYNPLELIKLLKQYNIQLFPEKKVNNDVYEVISKNCKLTPAIAITLLEDYVIEKDINKILKIRRIVKDGLTDMDIKILQILESNDKPIGEGSLAQRVGLNQGSYRIIYEPYLAEQGYLIRSARGRVIGKKGSKILEDISL